MTTAAEYRRYGEECRQLAEAMPVLRECMNEIADGWFALAAEHVVHGICSKPILPRCEL